MNVLVFTHTHLARTSRYCGATVTLINGQHAHCEACGTLDERDWLLSVPVNEEAHV